MLSAKNHRVDSHSQATCALSSLYPDVSWNASTLLRHRSRARKAQRQGFALSDLSAMQTGAQFLRYEKSFQVDIWSSLGSIEPQNQADHSTKFS
jgi:hypothetical protein